MERHRIYAKQLRSNMTEAEQRLWYFLRAGRFYGIKFKRQHPIGRYIVDFVSLKQSLIIELDGGQHAVHSEADAVRDRYLSQRGFRVLRFWNHEVLGETEAVLEQLRQMLSLD